MKKNKNILSEMELKSIYEKQKARIYLKQKIRLRLLKGDLRIIENEKNFIKENKLNLHDLDYKDVIDVYQVCIENHLSKLKAEQNL